MKQAGYSGQDGAGLATFGDNCYKAHDKPPIVKDNRVLLESSTIHDLQFDERIGSRMRFPDRRNSRFVTSTCARTSGQAFEKRRSQILKAMGATPCLAVALTVFLGVVQGAVAGEPQIDQWQVIYLGKDRIGFGRTTTQNVTIDQRTLVRTVQETEMRFKRFGQDVRLTVRLVTDDSRTGDMHGFALRFGDSPRRMVDASGKVDRGRLAIETTVAGRKTRSSKAWTRDMRSPAYEYHLYRTSIRRAGDVSRFKMYRPEENRVISVVVSADGIRPTRLLDQSKKDLLRTRTVMADLPTVTSFVDPAGNVVKTEMDLFGQRLVTYTVDRAEALKAISGRELDQAVQSLIPTDVIRKPHLSRKITYQIVFTRKDLADLIPTGATQTTRQIDSDTLEVTVVAAKPPAGRSNRKQSAEYLTANRYLQTQDVRVIEHARRAAGNQLDPWRISLAMERYVFEKLKQKNFSTALATAADVAKNLEGDCTEHAVLLAAMLRTRKIPSRLVGGLVYLERQGLPFFGGHMWTEVFVDGRWIPLDATLGRGGIGATHIKLSTSSFADDAPIPVTLFLPLMQLIGHLKIRVLSAD